MNEVPSRPADTPIMLGFWVYLMSDCLIFASFFATYAVLRTNTFGGPGPAALFYVPYALAETLILLTSSFTAGLAALSCTHQRRRVTALWLIATAALGLAFLALEVREFSALIRAGHGPSGSGFLTAYFSLVGVHGLHVAFGTLWLLALLAGLVRPALASVTPSRIMLWSLFWHFLDIIWILIFTIVYLLPFI